MDTLAQRIQLALSCKGISWSKAATSIGLSAQAATKWKKGQIGRKTMQDLAQLLDVDFEWLATGRNPMTDHSPRARLLMSRVREASDLVQDFTANDDKIDPNKTICRQITDDSMSPFFYKDDYVYAVPLAKYETGDYVIVKKSDGNDVVRVYTEYSDSETDETYQELVPLNKSFPVINEANEPFVILGAIIEHRRCLRTKLHINF